MDLPPALQQYKQKGLMASQQLQALGHRCGDNHVLVMRRPPRDSFGTIILPDIAQEKSSEGVVVAVGRGHLLPGGEYRPLFVKPGDYVTFSKYYGTETELGGVMFLQLLECEIENAL
jgi:chaperonin GroES